MNIIVVGCGKVGKALVEQLNEEGNNITVIDVSEAKVDDITSKYDCMGVVGNGATHVTQQEAGIDEADLLIAVTSSDELNLLCCLIAKMTGNCQTIARVRDPQYNQEARYLKDELGLAMVINPEHAAAAEIARVLRFPSAMKIDTFAKGRVELLKFRIPENSPLVGCAVKELATKLHCDVLVCTVERDNEAYIAYGDFVFNEKDIISVIASPKNVNAFFSRIKYRTNSVKDIIIVGGDAISHYLCEILHPYGVNIKLIEKDTERCEYLASKLDYVTIINADEVDQDVLMQEGLANTDGFVALTNFDEENILLSLFAKNRSKGKLVTKIKRIDFDDVISSLELDTVINPKNITAETIARYVRAMENTIGSNMERLYNVIRGKVEAAEFLIKEGSPVIGIPLAKLQLKPGVLVATILRDKRVIIPRGGDTIEAGDAVIIVTNHLSQNDISDFLK